MIPFEKLAQNLQTSREKCGERYIKHFDVWTHLYES